MISLRFAGLLVLVLIRLLQGESSVFLILILHWSRCLVANSETGDNVLVSLDVLLEQIIQETTALVDEVNESTAGGEVLGVLLEMFGEV